MRSKPKKDRTIKVAIIGVGYWGPNYARILSELKKSQLDWVCDLEKKNLDKIKDLYPNVKTTTSYRKILADQKVKAVIITTPLTSHFEIARDCLESQKHVLVEKPFTATSKEAKELQTLAKKNNLVLMVGHIYEYNSGIQELKRIIKKGRLGKIYYLSAERVGLGPIRKKASALWDLATHDISIALYLLEKLPQRVNAEGDSYIQVGVNDLVFLSLKFSPKLSFNIYVSWIAPEKIRRITVVGSKGMAIFDDVNKIEVLKIYDRKINRKSLNSTPGYIDHQSIVSIGDIRIPNIKQSEPLKNQVIHFLECILQKKKPLTDAQDGLNVVKILEAAERSLKEKREVKLDGFKRRQVR